MSAGTPGDFEYQGQELALFAGARRWRAYWQSRIGPYVGEEVLEVGAGIGTITADLAPATASWTALEPDTRLVAAMPTVSTLDGEVVVVAGTVSELEIGAAFDTVLYIDVLEHIEADAEELAAAADLLRPGGHLIVLVPAFPFLYSPFDASVGHHRR